MIESEKPSLSLDQINLFLESDHKAPILKLNPMSGGFWSSAYSYEVNSKEYVLRLSEMAEGYAIDAAAMQFISTSLPIPIVEKTGTVFGLNYSVSHRHHGQFIETLSTRQSDKFAGAMSALLQAMRSISPQDNPKVEWYKTQATSDICWHDWLLAGLSDSPDDHTAGWRSKIAKVPKLNQLFENCERRIHELLLFCPERRDLVHGDLLHQNVLVSDTAPEVTAIFSWKCSVLGDFLFDVAWCTFWSEWHPVIVEADMWQQTFLAKDLTLADLENASKRHHCYELQIAASHIGWFTWTEDAENLNKLVELTIRKLAQGPKS
jgi:aminoglycoside phosphotransferase (APT) family kinase protein